MDTKRALVSVYDKTGIVDFASALIALGYEIVQSDGYEKDKPNDVSS
jgi:AICAR transformylase/IMP cyclohydrolase PurH